MEPMRLTRKSVVAGVVVLFVFFVYANNTGRFSRHKPGSPTVLVHRGLSQRYAIPARLDNCPAAQMYPPRDEYLENTIASMQAAFDRGADVVEFDIHPTTDGHFAVFHDRSLECRTDGHGLTRAHSIPELKSLDIGYGYTSDGGRSYPFRGSGRGLMPSMDEVFEKFPDRAFLIDFKGNEAADGALLASRLSTLPLGRRSKLMIFGRDEPLAAVRERLPDMRMFSALSTTSCLLRYIAYGWTGVVPAICRHSPVFVPINVAPWLWGWPNLFMNRMDATATSIIVMGAYPANEISPGLDTREDLARLPSDFSGGVWTNDVKLVTTAIKKVP
jgi:glycerophosphoryl diester phosphodiesterase